jgi:glutamate-1-semialdehyde aminotransferase
MEITKSEQLWKKGKKLEINGTSLFSRGPKISIDGFAPKYCDQAKGSYFWDVDGNKFMDYGMAVGSIILGYGYIDSAIESQLIKGTTFTLLNPMEIELAETIRKNIPSCQRMKFLNSGSEATEAAVRIARSFTEKDIVIHDHYHGWMSWCVPLKSGVPKMYSLYSIKEDSNDIKRYQKLFEGREDDVACIIVEPMKTENISKDERTIFLKKLKQLCRKHGSLLIFDEVACGYRFGVGGAQKFFGVQPDISAFGKAIANGIPLSFVGCTEEIGNDVEEKIFVSSTFGAYALGLRSCLATTSIVDNQKVDKYLEYYGKRLKTEINKISAENGLDDLQIVGLPQRIGWKQTDWDLISLLFQEFIRNNIFFAWEIKNSFSHFENELSGTIETFQDIIKICKKAKEENNILKCIEGKPLRPIL